MISWEMWLLGQIKRSIYRSQVTSQSCFFGGLHVVPKAPKLPEDLCIMAILPLGWDMHIEKIEPLK